MEFQYSLKFQLLTDVSGDALVIEHEVTNKIAIPDVHGLLFPVS